MNDRFNNAVGPQVRAKKQGPGKVIPALAALSLGGGLQAATQFFANDMRYQEALGANVNHFYAPWGIIQWAAKWYGQYPDAFMRAGSVGVSVAGVGLISLVVVKMVMANTSKVNEYLHGSARWANKKDIQDAGLLPRSRKWHEILRGAQPAASNGVYVGAWVDSKGKLQYLRHNGPEHVLTYAPTRSGKGVGLVVPTLLSWPDSCVITDLKGELWAMTAGWRQKYAKNKVLRFEPADPNCEVFHNAMDEIRVGTGNEVGDVQSLATLIVDPDGKGLESHWQKTSQALLVGVILHALYKKKNEGTPASLPYVDAHARRSQPQHGRAVDGNGNLQPRQRQEPPSGRRRRPRHDGPPRGRGRVRPVNRQVLPGPVPRSHRGAQREFVQLPHQGPDEPRQPGKPVHRDAAERQGPPAPAGADHGEHDRAPAGRQDGLRAHPGKHALVAPAARKGGHRPGRRNLHPFQEGLQASAAGHARRVPEPRQAGNSAGVAGVRRRLRYQVLPDLPGHQPAQEPRDRLRPRRDHHVELPRPERLSAQPGRDRRPPVEADGQDDGGEGTDHDQRPAHQRHARPGLADHPGSPAPAADARRMPADARPEERMAN